MKRISFLIFVLTSFTMLEGCEKPYKCPFLRDDTVRIPKYWGDRIMSVSDFAHVYFEFMDGDTLVVEGFLHQKNSGMVLMDYAEWSDWYAAVGEDTPEHQFEYEDLVQSYSGEEFPFLRTRQLVVFDTNPVLPEENAILRYRVKGIIRFSHYEDYFEKGCSEDTYLEVIEKERRIEQ